MTDDVSKHYNVEWKRPLTKDECEQGFVNLRIDPARIFKTYKLGNHMLEHIVKKALRFTSKGHSAKKVLMEIIACAQCELNMMAEDAFEPVPELECLAGVGKVYSWVEYANNKPVVPLDVLIVLCKVKLENGVVRQNIAYSNANGFHIKHVSSTDFDSKVIHWEYV
ncbi:MAG: hypothetical protein COA47_09970 [Robiginitomaculum sp.]|nr:MAG: hypothetical protein COA47_09970 [Robiginitomaculum sp.]